MRLVLKDYQRDAAITLLRRIRQARTGLAEDGTPQTIVFSSATGSGKTVMAAAVLEALWAGGELALEASISPDPEYTVLWLSDRPDLNQQTRRRLGAVSETLTPERLPLIESTFDARTFEPGRAYFLNYQKLSRDALLVRPGDRRTWTIWETIANTDALRRGRFIIIIDEAHRGVGKSSVERREAVTIAQSFVVGGGTNARIRIEGGGTEAFPATSMIVGISATPQRFEDLLQAAPTRTRYQVAVSVDAIRGSGLIKDRIEIGSPEAGQSPDTMLGEACRKLEAVAGEWAAYTEANDLRRVRPILLVQVEDKGGGSISRTNLDQVVETLRQHLPSLTPDEVVHCFGDDGDVQLRSGWRIARERPDAIEALDRVRVVLFKTALNTGWDCPRAEVMMSYRTANDPTLIAQLVGRMVRTPLAHRIPGNDTLNTAYLYLPFYDDEHLDAVVRSLTSDAEGVPSEVVRERAVMETVPRAGSEQILTAISRLPSEAVPAAKPVPDLRRLFAFARALEQDGVADDCVAQAAEDGVQHIARWLEAAAAAGGSLQAQLDTLEQLTYSVFAYENGELVETDRHTTEVSESDIDRLYRTVSAQVSPEIAGRWLRHRYGSCEPLRAKAEFVAFASDGVARTALDALARARLVQLEREFGDVIRDLPRGRVEHYNDLRRSGRHVQLTTLIAPNRITFPLPAGSVQVPSHLYVRPGTDDQFETVLNGWEGPVIRIESRRPDFLGWLRNLPRKPWSLSYSYELNGLKPGYPDFLVFRRSPSGGVLVDILEPHQGEDAAAKAVGLARFCNSPRPTFDEFARVNMIRIEGERLYRLSLEVSDVRRAVIERVRTAEDLDRAFRDFATTEALN